MTGDFIPESTYAVQAGESHAFDPVFLGGAFNLNLSLYPIDETIALLGNAIGTEAANRLFVWAIPIISGICMTILLRYLLPKSRFGPLEYSMGALAYAVNPWYTSSVILAGHSTSIGVAYAATPLFLFLVLKTLRTRRILWGIPAALTLGLIFAAAYYWIFALAPALALLPLFEVDLRLKLTNLAHYFSDLLVTVAVMAGGLALSFYWLLPLASLVLSGGGDQVNILTSPFIYQLSQNANVQNSIRLVGYWGTPYSFGIYESSSAALATIYVICSYVFLFVAVLPIVFRKSTGWPTQRLWVFVAVSFLVYLLLACGTWVLGSIYLQLVYSLPVLDSPALWEAPLCLDFAITIPVATWFFHSLIQERPLPQEVNVALSRLAGRKVILSRSTTSRVGQVAVFLVVGSFLVSAWPNWTGDFNGANTTIPEPQPYLDADAWLGANSNGLRTLWLPSFGVYEAFAWSGRYGYDTLADPARFQTQSPVLNSPLSSVEAQTTSNFILLVQQLLASNQTRNIGEILSAAAVGYLAIRTDELPLSYDQALLESAFNQTDLALAFHEGPVYVFQNLEKTGYVFADTRSVVVYGGLESLSLLPWIGMNTTSTASIFPEQLGAGELSSILSERNPPEILLPASDPLSLLVSLIPPSYWVNLLPLATNEWQYDAYFGVPFGDLLYNGALYAHSDGAFNLTVPGGPDATSLFIQYLGNVKDYNISIDGHLLQPIQVTNPGGGYIWVEFSIPSSLWGGVLQVAPADPGVHSVANVVFAPPNVVETAQDEVDNVTDRGRIITEIPASNFAFSGDVSLSDEYTNFSRSPEELGLRFGGPNGGLAGAGSVLNLTSAPYRFSFFGNSTLFERSSNLSLNLFGWAPTGWVFSKSIPVQLQPGGLGWASSVASVPAGPYRYQVTGSDFTFSELVISPLTADLSLADNPIEGPGLTGASLTNNLANGGALDGTILAKNVTALSFAYDFDPQWQVVLDGHEASPIALSGFQVGTLLPVEANGSISFSLIYNPNGAGNLGWDLTYFSLGVFAVLAIAAVVAPRLLPALNLRIQRKSNSLVRPKRLAWKSFGSAHKRTTKRTLDQDSSDLTVEGEAD